MVTVSFAGFVLKVVPIIRIVSPCFPHAGFTLVMLKAAGILTANKNPESMIPFTATVPDALPIGTITYKVSAPALITCAEIPLNLTVSLEGVSEKLVPIIVTVSPGLAFGGFTDLTVTDCVGGGGGGGGGVLATSFFLQELKKRKTSIPKNRFRFIAFF
jgi:hypothetical protein